MTVVYLIIYYNFCSKKDFFIKKTAGNFKILACRGAIPTLQGLTAHLGVVESKSIFTYRFSTPLADGPPPFFSSVLMSNAGLRTLYQF